MWATAPASRNSYSLFLCISVQVSFSCTSLNNHNNDHNVYDKNEQIMCFLRSYSCLFLKYWWHWQISDGPRREHWWWRRCWRWWRWWLQAALRRSRLALVSVDSLVFQHEAVGAAGAVSAPLCWAERSVSSQTGLPVSSIPVVPVPGDSHPM